MKRYLIISLLAVVSVIGLQAGVLECFATEADYRPWSGWWWPFDKGGLVTGSDYNGHPAPLEKYDYVTSGVYFGPATKYGYRNYYEAGALSWQGMCFCWAAASILEKEPQHKGIYKGMAFYVGDKKGLLTAAYDSPIYYYHPINNPLDFHQILSQFVGPGITPVIMDLAFAGEIWNHPVFKYTSNYTLDGNTRHYETTIWYITDQVHPDYVGSAALQFTYHYYFVIEDGIITGSGWEYGSISNHPRNTCEPYGTHGWNTGLDYDEVIKIVTTDGDGYNDNNSFENAALLSIGQHSLILNTRLVEDTNPFWENEIDYFKVAVKAGDILTIQAEAVDKSLGIILRTYNPERELIEETEISGLESGVQVVDAEIDGNYFIEISAPSGQSGEPCYELTLKQELAFQGIFPDDPSGSWATGIALLKPESSEGRTIISQIDRDGFIQAVYSDNSPVRHLVGLEGNFGLSCPDKGYLRVDSDTPVMGLEIEAYGDYLLLGCNLIPAERISREVFLPYYARTGGWQSLFGLINAGDESEVVVRRSYDQEGELLASDTITLDPGQKVEHDTSYISILLYSGAATMSASTESGRESLISYIKFLNPSEGLRGRALVPLITEGETQLVAPHIASNGYWTTDIAVMNSGYSESTVRFYAFDEAGNLINTADYVLKAKQNVVNEVSDIFPGIPSGEIASVKIVSVSTQPICGLMIYGNADGLQLAGMPLHAASASTIYLPHIACFGKWNTGIGVINAGYMEDDVSFYLLDAEGEVLSTRIYHMAPNQHMAITVTNLFDNEISQAGKYLKIESEGGQPLSGIYLIATSDGFRLMGDAMGF